MARQWVLWSVGMLVGGATSVVAGNGERAATKAHTWVDVDRDGYVDLVRYRPGSEAQILLNDGLGGFELAEGLEDLERAGRVRSVLALDIDGDEVEEWVVAGDVATHLYSGTRLVQTLPACSSLSSRDFDRDGQADLLLDHDLYRVDSRGNLIAVVLPDFPDGADPASGGGGVDLEVARVQTEHVGDAAITARKIAPGAIGAAQIAVGAVEPRHLTEALQELRRSGADGPSVSGNVGINVASPKHEVHMARNPDGDATSRMLIQNDTTTDTTAPAEVAFDRRALGSEQLGAIGVDTSDRDFYIHMNGKDRVNVSDDGFVGIGRNFKITSFEQFGIESTSAIGFGGMYINTVGSEGKPFYGYSTGREIGAYHYYDGSARQWRLYSGGDRLVVDRDSGNVGVSYPNALEGKLDVWSSDGNSLYTIRGRRTESSGPAGRFEITSANNGSPSMWATNDGIGSAGTFETRNTSNQSAAIWATSIGTGYGSAIYSASEGIGATQYAYNNGSGSAGHFEITDESNDSAALWVYSASSGDHGSAIYAQSQGLGATVVGVNSGEGSGAYFSTAGPYPAVWADGTISADMVEIRGGADLAERFHVAESVEPGTVMSLDVERAGYLRESTKRYDRTVVGVVSGAETLAPGVILGAWESDEPSVAVALTGRTWVKCDARERAIQPGDPLTTSDLPGHAMAIPEGVDSQAAVLGKAMSGLEQGEVGMVLAVVSLQ